MWRVRVTTFAVESNNAYCVFFQYYLINGKIFEEKYEDKMGVLIFSTNSVLFYEKSKHYHNVHIYSREVPVILPRCQ